VSRSLYADVGDNAGQQAAVPGLVYLVLVELGAAPRAVDETAGDHPVATVITLHAFPPPFGTFYDPLG